MGYHASTPMGAELAAWLAWNHPGTEIDDRAVGAVCQVLLDGNQKLADVPAGTRLQMYQIAAASFRIEDSKSPRTGRIRHLSAVKD